MQVRLGERFPRAIETRLGMESWNRVEITERFVEHLGQPGRVIWQLNIGVASPKYAV